MAGFLNRQIKDGRKRVRESGAEGSILDSILEKEWEEEKAGQQLLSVSELRDELNILLIAGSETTANTMAWVRSRSPERARLISDYPTFLLGLEPDAPIPHWCPRGSEARSCRG